MRIRSFFAAVGGGSLNLEQYTTPAPSGGVSGTDYLRDGQVGMAKCSVSTRLWSWLRQVYSWLRLCAFTEKSERVQPVTLSWLTLRLCARQEKRWEGPVECKGQETWKHPALWMYHLPTHKSIDKWQKHSCIKVVQYNLYSITGWLVRYVDIGATPGKADWKENPVQKMSGDINGHKSQ